MIANRNISRDAVGPVKPFGSHAVLVHPLVVGDVAIRGPPRSLRSP